MRTLLGLLALTLALLATASQADAQVVFPSGPPVYAASADGWGLGTYPVPPYSYYAALPFAARDYVGYGYNDFPYYGMPYGSPSDPWTWPAMSRPYFYRTLSRYYYPPVQ